LLRLFDQTCFVAATQSPCLVFIFFNGDENSSVEGLLGGHPIAPKTTSANAASASP